MEKESYLQKPIFAEAKNCIKFVTDHKLGRKGYAGNF